jgi:hypothetical protein
MVAQIVRSSNRPSLDKSSLAGPADTLSVEGTAALFALGVRLIGPNAPRP